MAFTEADVQACLATVVDPNTGRDFVAGKSVKKVTVTGSDVAVELTLGYPAKSQHESMKRLVRQAVAALPGAGRVTVTIVTKVVSHAVQRGVKLVPGVKNIVAVASGKGGVGKSTTAVNLALALAAEGATVGLLDADIYGPSQPMMLGIAGRPESTDGKTLEPMEAYGLQAMSIGFLIDADTPMVWRGPMVTQALEQLLKDTNWRELDFLVVDMRPARDHQADAAEAQAAREQQRDQGQHVAEDVDVKHEPGEAHEDGEFDQCERHPAEDEAEQEVGPPHRRGEVALEQFPAPACSR